jgi:OPA family glycerol-3-phosphate transporter-like MFS transporter
VEKQYLNKKNASTLVVACWLAYTLAYVGRLNYNANLIEVITSLSVSKAEAGTVSAAFFMAYGIGQLGNGILSRFYNGKWAIFGALIASAVINFAMPMLPNVEAMRVFWLGNGIAQSFLWCNLIRILAKNLSDQHMPGAIFAMSTTVAVGTFLAYGLSALCVTLFTWRWMFMLSSVTLVVAGIVWMLFLTRVERAGGDFSPNGPKQTGEKLKTSPWLIGSIIVFGLLGLGNGFVKDGVITWTPSLLFERFQLSSAFSIAVTLVIPLLSVLGAWIAKWLTRRHVAHMAQSGLLFGAASALLAVAAGALSSLYLPVMMAILVGIACLMAAVNNVLTSMVPLAFREHADSGFLAGLINTFCYGGSMASAVWIGRVADRGGWNSVFLWLTGVSLVAVVVSLAGSKVVGNRRKET